MFSSGSESLKIPLILFVIYHLPLYRNCWLIHWRMWLVPSFNVFRALLHCQDRLYGSNLVEGLK